jgi:small-conductance mechanosensitive channel
MADSGLQKKAIFFMIFSGIVIVILLSLPVVENIFRSYLLSEFGIALTPEGYPVPRDGDVPTGMMTETAISLVANILHLVKIFLWMALVIAFVRFVSSLIFATAFRNASQSEISSLVRTVFSIVIYIVAFFIIFQSQYPRVELAPLFTGSTIIGIVVGLALQDTLGNLFAGIALQADQPFLVGDVIKVSERATGVVESVSWRGVKIRTFQNKLVVVSNAVMGKEMIEVAPRGNLNARIVHFSTEYAHSPSRTIQLVREAVRQVENVSNKIRPVVRIRNLADNGIEYEIKYWADDYTKYNDTDALIRQRLWYLFTREKIEVPIPSQTIYLEKKADEITHETYVEATSERLSNVPIFAPLSEDELEKLANASGANVFAPGEVIVRRGQEGNSMFVITRGAVKVQVPEENYQRTINRLKRNDFFGEMSLLTGQPRTANVIAKEETEVLRIEKAALKPLFENNPRLMADICEIIEERRALLLPDEEEQHKDKTAEPAGGVLLTLKKFFGMG